LILSNSLLSGNTGSLTITNEPRWHPSIMKYNYDALTLVKGVPKYLPLAK